LLAGVERGRPERRGHVAVSDGATPPGGTAAVGDEPIVPRPGRGPIFQIGTTTAALTTAGTSITVAVPEGVQERDLLLAMFALGNSADTTPTG
jgi:hypothetical protein